MSSIKDYVDENMHKDAITQILKTTFKEVKAEDYEEVTEMVAAKLAYMNVYRKSLEETDPGDLQEVADSFNVPKESIVDSFVYFTLILDNVLLQKELAEYLPDNEEDDGEDDGEDDE
jgi:predicted DNA-binding protein YlxM (UPF0122 family)